VLLPCWSARFRHLLRQAERNGIETETETESRSLPGAQRPRALEQVHSPLILQDQMRDPPGACEGKDPHVALRVVLAQRGTIPRHERQHRHRLGEQPDDFRRQCPDLVLGGGSTSSRWLELGHTRNCAVSPRRRRPHRAVAATRPSRTACRYSAPARPVNSRSGRPRRRRARLEQCQVPDTPSRSLPATSRTHRTSSGLWMTVRTNSQAPPDTL